MVLLLSWEILIPMKLEASPGEAKDRRGKPQALFMEAGMYHVSPTWYILGLI
jgi:hypothetical protein